MDQAQRAGGIEGSNSYLDVWRGFGEKVRMEGTRGKRRREEGSRSRERSPGYGKEGLGVVLLIGASQAKLSGQADKV